MLTKFMHDLHSATTIVLPWFLFSLWFSGLYVCVCLGHCSNCGKFLHMAVIRLAPAVIYHVDTNDLSFSSSVKFS